MWNLISGTNFGITQNGSIYSIAGKIGDVNIHSKGLSVSNRSAFVGSEGSRNGVHISAGNNDLSPFGGISLGSEDEGSELWYEQYLWAGRHDIQGYNGNRYVGLRLWAGGIRFLCSTTEIKPNDNTDSVASIEVGLDGATFKGTWKNASGAIIITSDRNAKNTINTVSDKYSVLFDNLEPVTYKYNCGTSGRLHLGFIAQSVSEAMGRAGVSSDEFAALCIENKDSENGLWGLRYEEFIALNTYEIQKLKPRMTAAEEKITQLEQEILELKQEIATLKR